MEGRDRMIPRFIVLSKTRCLPCRQLHSLLENMEIDMPIMWHHDKPQFFEDLGIKAVPALIKEVRKNEYSIKAIGLPEIKKYISTNRIENNTLYENENLNEEEE